MASFSATGSINGSYVLELNVWESYVSGASDNYSTVNWEVYLKSTGGYSFATIGSTIVVNVDGEVYNSYSQKDLSAGGSIRIASGSKNVWHNSDGNKTINCSASYTQSSTAYYTPGNMSCGGNLGLAYIPRYANFTKHYVEAKSINTVTMHWEADRAINAWQHSINGGAWQDCNGGNSYVISNLKPNTTYNIRTRIKSTDSGLWTESGTQTVTTYNIATLTEANDLEIGKNYTVKYNNPSGAEVKISILQTDGNTIIVPYRICIGTSYTFEFTEEEIENLYKLCGTNNEYKARVYLQTNQNNKTYTDYKEITVNLTGIVKSITVSVGGIIKKGRIWVGTSAGNKAGVFVVGTSNGNRRGA